MVTRTVQDLATRTMKLLGLLEAQEEASAEDFGDISHAYENRYADLVFREIAWWPQAEIPLEAFEFMARIMADEVASAFGRSTPMEVDENGRTVSMGMRGLRGLKRISQRAATGLPAPANYF